MREANQKNDRRVLKTKRNLRQTLIELMKIKPFEKITIRELCDCADVNRNTFYYHYDSAQALLDEILSELLTEIEEAEDGITDIPEGIRKLCLVYEKNKELLQILLVEQPNILFIKKLVRSGLPFVGVAVSDLNKDISPENKEMVSNYIIFGILAVFCTWLKQDEEKDTDRVSEVINTLMRYDPIQAIRKL